VETGLPLAQEVDERDERNERGWQVESLACIFLFNVLLTAVIGIHFLSRMPPNASFGGWIASLVGLASTAVFVNLLLLIPLAPVTILVKRWWFTTAVVPLLLGALGVFVYLDSVIFRLYGFHINGMVLSIVFAPAADDSFTLGVSTYASARFWIAVIVAAELSFALGAMKLLRRWKGLRHVRRWWVLLIAGGVLFGVMLVDKVTYAVADIKDDVELMRSGYLFPLYPKVTAKRFAQGRLGVKVLRRESLKVDVGASALDYPKSPLVFPEGGTRPNVVMIVLEGARFDGLDPKAMPFLHAFAEENIRCERHFTGGNNTRHAVFTLMYGVHSMYFDRFLVERRGPVLVSELKKLGYAFRIIGSAQMDFSEFRKTSFVEVVETVTDEWDQKLIRYERDRLLTDLFIEFLDKNGKEGEKPFFSFLFYDASHQPYIYPPEHEVFPTDLTPEDIDYIKIAGDFEKAKPLVKRFMNSLHYDDGEIRRVVEALRERGLMKNTLLFVLGDHGEEFGESGYMGHNSSFDRWQAQTIMVAHVPGEKRRRITRLTSHIDVVPTILTYMGAENPPEHYSLGTPLTASDGPEFVVAGSWINAAVIDAELVATFGLEALNAREVLTDWDAKPLADEKRGRSSHHIYLRKLMEDMRHFVH
jgi:membrane-anchored protein YejM (alkaline phosphatase superfamily)